jgi:diacylglycerol kinase (ATP)
MPSAYLAYNPAAGRYPSWLLAERAANLLSKEGWDIRIVKTQSGEHITRLAYRAAAEQVDAFIVVGGDGSLNRALPGLIGSHTALGVLPAGTANVWGQELGLPGLSWTRLMALEESSRQLAEPRICEMDVGLCNQTPFFLWSGVGLDAFIVHRIEPRNRWEKHFAVVQYATSAIWNASQWGGMNLRVITEGHQIDGHFMLAVVNNIHLYAGGLANLSPDALLNDGMMDLWLFEGSTLGDTVQQAWDLWAGRHVQSEQVHRIGFHDITLDSESPMYTQVDGEPGEVESQVVVKVLPRALRVLVPDSAPASLF